jgi:hypothetical protein
MENGYILVFLEGLGYIQIGIVWASLFALKCVRNSMGPSRPQLNVYNRIFARICSESQVMRFFAFLS